MAFYPCVLSWVDTVSDEVNLFPDRATIYEPPAADAGDFGEASSSTYPTDWTALVTSEPCRLYPAQVRANEALTAAQIQEHGDYRCLFRADLPRPSVGARVRITQGALVLDFEIAGVRDSSDRVYTSLELRRANPSVIES